MSKDKSRPEYKITMVRSPNLTDEEIERRIAIAFDLILNFKPTTKKKKERNHG